MRAPKTTGNTSYERKAATEALGAWDFLNPAAQALLRKGAGNEEPQPGDERLALLLRRGVAVMLRPDSADRHRGGGLRWHWKWTAWGAYVAHIGEENGTIEHEKDDRLKIGGGLVTEALRSCATLAAAHAVAEGLTQEQLDEIKAGRLHVVGNFTRGLRLERVS